MSAKGTSTFILQRSSAVLLLPLAIWFIWSLMSKAGQPYGDVLVWLGQPLNLGLFGAFVTVGAFHGRIGVGEVIDDYLGGTLKTLATAANWMVAVGVIVVTWWSLLSL